MRKRFMEHTRKQVADEYNVLDVDAGRQGIRKVVWKGWGWTPEKRAVFKSRRAEVVELAKQQLSATCIFAMNLDAIPRLLERVEGAITNHFYKAEDCLIDRGMLLMPRCFNAGM
jgi:hypothetical protein